MAQAIAAQESKSLQVPGGHSHRRQVNVNETERLLCTVGGGALTLFGLSQRNLGGLALAIGGGLLVQRGLTGHCMMYETLGINTADEHGSAASVAAGKGFHFHRTVTVNAPPEKCYQFWRQLDNLPRILPHLETVSSDGAISHWVAKGPLGFQVEWDAEIINERDNELIAWKSLRGAMLDHAGSVHFRPAPGGRGTVVEVDFKYDPPGGKAAGLLSKLFRRAPEQELRDGLRCFRQLMETGDIITTAGQSTCHG